ncbi:MAG: purine-cytosine permease family protein [Nocardioidaceae bacterium]
MDTTTDSDGRVGTSRTAIEDYALRQVPQTWSWPWRSVVSAVLGAGTAMFFLAFGGQLASAYGAVNTLIACVFALIVQGSLCYILVRQSSRRGQDIDLLSRGAGFGFLGSAVTSIIYWGNFLFFFGTEGDILAHAVSSTFPIVPLNASYAIMGLIFIPLCIYGMKFMAWFQSWTLPLYVALIVAAIVVAGLGHGAEPVGAGTAVGIQAESGSSVGGLNLVRAMGAATGLMGIIALLVSDFARFAPKRAKGNRTGSFLTAFFPENAMTWFFGLPLGIWFYASTQETNPGVYLVGILGYGGFIFVLLTQIRINVTNVYSGSLALANFFSRAARFTPGRLFWVVIMTLLGTGVMYTNILQYATAVEAFLGVFLFAWLGCLVADVLFVKGWLRLGPRPYEYRRAFLVEVNPVGLSAVVAGIIVGCVLLAGTGQYLAYLPSTPGWDGVGALSSLVALVVSAGVHVGVAWLTRGRSYLRRPIEAHPGAEDTQHCPNCGEIVSTNDLIACPYEEKWICAHCCMGNRHCGDQCAHDWPVRNVEPVPVRIGWAGQQPDDERSRDERVPASRPSMWLLGEPAGDEDARKEVPPETGQRL